MFEDHSKIKMARRFRAKALLRHRHPLEIKRIIGTNQFAVRTADFTKGLRRPENEDMSHF